jgi:hypothetical protein
VSRSGRAGQRPRPGERARARERRDQRPGRETQRQRQGAAQEQQRHTQSHKQGASERGTCVPGDRTSEPHRDLPWGENVARRPSVQGGDARHSRAPPAEAFSGSPTGGSRIQEK